MYFMNAIIININIRNSPYYSKKNKLSIYIIRGFQDVVVYVDDVHHLWLSDVNWSLFFFVWELYNTVNYINTKCNGGMGYINVMCNQRNSHKGSFIYYVWLKREGGGVVRKNILFINLYHYKKHNVIYGRPLSAVTVRWRCVNYSIIIMNVCGWKARRTCCACRGRRTGSTCCPRTPWTAAGPPRRWWSATAGAATRTSWGTARPSPAPWVIAVNMMLAKYISCNYC